MSLAFHRAHPQRVRALLIIDTGPGFKKDDARDAEQARARHRERFEREVWRAEIAEPRTLQREPSRRSGLALAARGLLASAMPA